MLLNCARALWNVDKDLLDLLMYARICCPTFTSTFLYSFVSSGVLPFLFLAVEPSATKRIEAALNYMLESVRKFVDIVIRAPQHIIN